MDGLIGVDKGSGLTSHDVVARIRRITGERTAGHTGTLDPWATGVLVVCMGKATRLSRFLMESPKSYEAEIVFGDATDTGDSRGYVIASNERLNLCRGQVFAALERFVGDIMQIPPMVSAVHHQGRRLYEIAREGVVVAREARPVTVYGISALEPAAWPENIRHGSSARIAVTCSKGTYIRTLCEDICSSLGTPGHMGELRRTSTSGFNIQECVNIEQIAAAAAAGDYSGILHPMSRAVANMPSLILSSSERRLAVHGSRISVPSDRVSGVIAADPSGQRWVALMGADDELVALAIADAADAAVAAGASVWLQPRVVLAEEA